MTSPVTAPSRSAVSAAERALIALGRELPSDAVIRDRDVLVGYAGDESEVQPVVPEAVVRVRDTGQVSAVMRACHAHGVPVTPRAGGTSRVGGSVPVVGGIVLAFEQMNGLLGIEQVDLLAVAQPGLVTGELHRQVEDEGLFYPPDPNSLATCALGGNIAANAGGPRAFKYGVTREYVLGMQAVMADGTVLRLGKRTVKGVTGYDLTALMVGSEGTLGVVTEATLRLVPKPEAVATLLVFLPDDESVGRAVGAMLALGIVPRCVELLDRIALDLVRPAAGVPVPDGARAMILVELDGAAHALEAQRELVGNAMMDASALEVLVADKGSERERLWAARRELSHTLRRAARHKLSEDVVVPRSRIADLLAVCRALAERHGIVMPTYGHAGDGNLHVNFLWEDDAQRPAVDMAIRGLFEQVVAMGGTLSGEHGIGVLKAPYLPLEQSPALIALQERIKDVFDPRGILNPGKIFPGAAKRYH
ncbi:MAG: FAD-binding protein, partial [Myxococcales bacterium]|nr:FAD-binding protein [Myxococcales bacterium]